ncbi:hypothetical protein L7F22_021152 [Adiantum nelumboides]|nr:hypothetical protein [Adiantum nelumboides]
MPTRPGQVERRLRLGQGHARPGRASLTSQTATARTRPRQPKPARPATRAAATGQPDIAGDGGGQAKAMPGHASQPDLAGGGGGQDQARPSRPPSQAMASQPALKSGDRGLGRPGHLAGGGGQARPGSQPASPRGRRPRQARPAAPREQWPARRASLAGRRSRPSQASRTLRAATGPGRPRKQSTWTAISP